jgi:long-chain fatty acid transport protein
MRARATTAVPFVTLALILASVSLPLRAQEFTLYEVGTRAAALGGAFTAKADDITAIYYNPAGLAFLDGWRLKTNVGVSTRHFNAYVPIYDVTFSSKPKEYLQNIFLSWRPFKRVGLGVGYYSPYNYSSRWAHPYWTGADISVAASLKVYDFRSVVAVEILNGLAVSAALDVYSMSVSWDHMVEFEMANYPLPEPTLIDSRHSLSGHGLGFSAGVLWKAIPALQVGVRYQSSVAMSLNGSNSFGISQSYYSILVPDPYRPYRGLADLLAFYYVPQFVTGEMTLPQEISGGLALTPLRRLSLYLDLQWDSWSKLGPWQFRSVNSDANLSPGFTSDYQEFWGVTPNYGTQAAPLVLRDAMKVKAGLEYRLGKWFALRGGYARGQSSVEAANLTPLLPDLGQDTFSFGGGYEGPLFSIYNDDETVGQLTLDLVLRYSSSARTASTISGLDATYSAKRWTVGVGVGFNF